MIKNIFSVDVEEWYHSGYTGTKTPGLHPSRLEKPIDLILSILHQTKNTATFFVLGEIAKKQPELIRKISLRGHEIACHSYNHQFIYNLTKKTFENDLKRAKDSIEDASQQKVIGYRAPAWSVSLQQTPWFWQTLKRNGFKYSSSLFPRKTFLYGDSNVSRQPHHINNILEVPPSVFRFFGQRIPFSGGFYFRLTPFFFISLFSQFLNIHQLPTIFYIHPRELDPNQPRLRLDPIKNFIHYYGICQTSKKIFRLLRKFPTTSFKNYFRLD